MWGKFCGVNFTALTKTETTEIGQEGWGLVGMGAGRNGAGRDGDADFFFGLIFNAFSQNPLCLYPHR